MLNLAVEPRSSVFIGRSGDVRSADKSFEVDWQGRPFISATSMRGRLRAQLESLAKAMGLKVCNPPRPERMCKGDLTSPDCIRQACIACRIFGNPWLPSSIAVSDLRAVPVNTLNGDPMMPPLVRTHVSISRRAGTAAEERLFSLEVPGRSMKNGPFRYIGSVSGDLTEAELGFLLVAAASLEHIGGGKGRGLGAIKMIFDGLALADRPSAGRDADQKVIADLMRLALEGGVASE